jgi:hypothetical protein
MAHSQFLRAKRAALASGPELFFRSPSVKQDEPPNRLRALRGGDLFWSYARNAEFQWLPGSRPDDSRCRAGSGESA